MGNDDGVGGAEHAIVKEAKNVVHEKIKSVGVLLDAPERVDAGLGNLTSLDGGGGEVLGGEDGEPISVAHKNLHDARIDGAENGLGDNGEIHGIGLAAHLRALETIWGEMKPDVRRGRSGGLGNWTHVPS